jgi:hypothetical protein
LEFPADFSVRLSVLSTRRAQALIRFVADASRQLSCSQDLFGCVASAEGCEACAKHVCRVASGRKLTIHDLAEADHIHQPSSQLDRDIPKVPLGHKSGNIGQAVIRRAADDRGRGYDRGWKIEEFASVLGEAARYIPLGCDAIQTTGVAIDDNGANILITERLNNPTDGLIAANRYDDVSSAAKDVGYLHDALPSLAISLASGLAKWRSLDRAYMLIISLTAKRRLRFQTRRLHHKQSSRRD